MRAAAVRTVEEKEEQLKSRKNQQRALGKQIDKMISEGQHAQQGSAVGCGGPGLCPSIGRGLARMLGLSRSAGAVATSEIEVGVEKPGVQRAMGGQVGMALFGKPLGKKGTAAGKLEAATSAMRARVEELDRRVATGKAASMAAMKAGNKQLAMRELKRAKMMEKQAFSTQSALDAVEAQSDMLEQTALQREVASALGATAKSLKSQKGLLSKAEDAVDAAAEMRDLHEDLSQVMAGLGESTSNDYDEDDLMEELQGMMADDTADPPAAANGVAESENMRKAQEELERQHALYDEAERMRQGLPAAPTTIVGSGKAAMNGRDSVALLAQ
tara:strand:- start:2267 stop:3253 length:987 start_codon:yes stop_codon:yes gene_type:complete